jgi:hypothetical protein
LYLGETTLVVSDGDAARLASRLVGGRDVQDTVSINVEGNFNLWNTTRSRRNARQLKLAEEVVVLDDFLVGTVVTLDEGSPPAVSIPRERGATSRRRS